jgi:hypothetical protein
MQTMLKFLKNIKRVTYKINTIKAIFCDEISFLSSLNNKLETHNKKLSSKNC